MCPIEGGEHCSLNSLTVFIYRDSRTSTAASSAHLLRTVAVTAATRPGSYEEIAFIMAWALKWPALSFGEKFWLWNKSKLLGSTRSRHEEGLIGKTAQPDAIASTADRPEASTISYSGSTTSGASVSPCGNQRSSLMPMVSKAWQSWDACQPLRSKLLK